LSQVQEGAVVTHMCSAESLFDGCIATFEGDGGIYSPKDAGGFIKLNALRMRIAARKQK